MINIDFLTLKAFLTENIDFFIGARLQKIQQPTRKEFVLCLRNYSESRKFYININPQIYHICFMNKITEELRNLQKPIKPPMFCMQLRKYLEGAKIIDASVKENERILELDFENYDELSQKRTICLCIELMGKHSNVILYDKENYNIIGCAHNVGSDKSRYREVFGGIKYIYPPNGNTGLSDELKKQFEGLNETDKNSYLFTETYRPAILEERYTLFQELIPNSNICDSVNEMLDNYYSKFQYKINLQNTKNKLLELANTKLKKVLNSIEKISLLLKKRDNLEKYKLYGELLTANIYQKKDYQNSIEVFDYENNKNILIELDNTKTLSENAQRYFKLYSKAKTTKEKSTEMLQQLNIEKEYLENLIYSINSAENTEDLDEISEELLETQNKKQEKKSIKIMQKEINGFQIYIGKNNKQNNYIVSKLMKENDLWFHTKTCAGSHVLLKIFGKEPDEKTILECCKLAREFSSSEYPSKISVIYTLGKFVKKPPAAPLGYVIYKNEKEILI